MYVFKEGARISVTTSTLNFGVEMHFLRHDYMALQSGPGLLGKKGRGTLLEGPGLHFLDCQAIKE